MVISRADVDPLILGLTLEEANEKLKEYGFRVRVLPLKPSRIDDNPDYDNLCANVDVDYEDRILRINSWG